MTSEQLTDIALPFVIRIGIALLILIAGNYLSRGARAVTNRLVNQPQVLEIISPTIARLLVRIVHYSLLGLALILALIVLGVPAQYVLTALAIIVIVLGVALQQSLANLAATIIFLIFQPFRRGELIETMGRTGTVQEIQLFNTVLLQGNQQVVSLPNSKVQESGVLNYSRMEILRVDVQLTVDYSEDIEHLRALLFEIVKQDPRVLEHPPAECVVQSLGANGVAIEIRPMVKREDYWATLSDLRAQVASRFRAEGILFGMPRQLLYTSQEAKDDKPIADSHSAS